MVTVKYRGRLREMTGRDEETVSALRVSEVLRHIKSAYGNQARKEAVRMLIVVDGESILLRQGFRTELRGGETVRFFPLCAGG